MDVAWGFIGFSLLGETQVWERVVQ